MEQGSTNLCTSTVNDNGSYILQEIPHLDVESRLRELQFWWKGEPESVLLPVLRSCLGIQASRCLSLPGHFRRLIFEAIRQCEVKDVKVVMLSEEFFTSVWPIVVSAVVLLAFVYLYYKGYIDRGGSKVGSSDCLDFRDIYISIILFLAAYVWIKFRNVIPQGAVYYRRDSNKWEPRIKFPVMKGVGGKSKSKSKRIPLGSYDTKADGEVVYRIAAFYCNKPMHCLGRLNLGRGAYFHIPALSVDPSSTYEKQVNQIRDQVLKAYAEFEEQKTSRNLSPHVPGLALEMPTGEGALLMTPPIQQRQEPLNSGMDLTMQGQGSQLGPSTQRNGVDFNNPDSLHLVLLQTQHELLETKKENERLKAQLSRTKVENNKQKQRNSELECEKGLLNQQIMQLQSQLPPLDSELDFDPVMVFNTGHEESLAR